MAIERADVIEKRFVDAFLGPAAGCQWKAAQIAGCNGKTMVSLSVLGNRLLGRDSVQALLRERLARAAVTPDRVLRRLVQHLDADITDCFEILEDGTPRINLKIAQQLERTGVIKKVRYRSRAITINDDTVFEKEVEVELHDSQAAAMKLAKLMGMVPEKRGDAAAGGAGEKAPQNMDEWIEKLEALGVPESDWPIVVLEHRKRRRVQSREAKP